MWCGKTGSLSIRLLNVIFKTTYLCSPRLKKKNETLVVNSKVLKILLPLTPENVCVCVGGAGGDGGNKAPVYESGSSQERETTVVI